MISWGEFEQADSRPQPTTNRVPPIVSSGDGASNVIVKTARPVYAAPPMDFFLEAHKEKFGSRLELENELKNSLLSTTDVTHGDALWKTVVDQLRAGPPTGAEDGKTTLFHTIRSWLAKVDNEHDRNDDEKQKST